MKDDNFNDSPLFLELWEIGSLFENNKYKSKF